MKKKRWCGLHSAQCNLPHLPILLLKACGVGSNWRRAGNNQLLTKAACGKAAGAISGRSLIRTHCIPPFSFPLYPAVFHTLTLIIPHCMYTFYIFSYTLILFFTLLRLLLGQILFFCTPLYTLHFFLCVLHALKCPLYKFIYV